MNSPRHPLSALLLCGLLLLIPNAPAQAGSATWNLNPTTGDWNTASNWTPATVPNGPADVASFATSAALNPLVDSNIELDRIVFNPGASAFTISANSTTALLTLSGAGVINQSGQTQHFVTKTATGQIQFINSASAGTSNILYSNNAVAGDAGITSLFDTATAGTAVFDNAGSGLTGGSAGSTQFFGNSSAGDATFTNQSPRGFSAGGSISFNDSSSASNGTFANNGGGNIYFSDASTANSATFTNTGTISFYENSTGGSATFENKNALQFFNFASAENAAITNEGVSVSGTPFGLTIFIDAGAGNATIINNGSAINSISGGTTVFNAGSNAENSTLIANNGVGTSVGGAILFEGDGDGGTSRNEIFGNGTLSVGDHAPPGVTVGSIEGDGIIDLGANNLTVGSNGLSTTFSGLLQDGGTLGSLTKIGTGTLTLSGANTYTGGTTINAGTLVVTNRRGSGTGSGQVRISGGKLGGTGKIVGNVIVGNGSSPEAFLTPGIANGIPAVLTLQKKVAFLADGTLHFGYKSSNLTADYLIVRGVTISSGAELFFGPIDSGTLPIGTLFTVIDNRAGTPITGTFSNIADGGTVTVGSNTFQANYEGGDGNDLTLTVVP
jgi:autotransporter-associated beta strand protein